MPNQMCEWGQKANQAVERELNDMKEWVNKLEEKANGLAKKVDGAIIGSLVFVVMQLITIIMIYLKK